MFICPSVGKTEVSISNNVFYSTATNAMETEVDELSVVVEFIRMPFRMRFQSA